jgi:hypothetical protein
VLRFKAYLYICLMLSNAVLGKPAMACEQMVMAMPNMATMQHSHNMQADIPAASDMSMSSAEHAAHMSAEAVSGTEMSGTEMSATHLHDDHASSTFSPEDNQHALASQHHDAPMQMDCCDNDCHCPTSACVSISALLNQYQIVQLTPPTEMAMPYHFTSLTHINSHLRKPPIVTLI